MFGCGARFKMSASRQDPIRPDRPDGRKPPVLVSDDVTRLPLDRATWPLLRRLVAEHVRPQAARLAGALVCMALAAAATAGVVWLMEPVLDEQHPHPSAA